MPPRRIFIEAVGRNTGEEKMHSHLYEDTGDALTPMCRHGWNRSDGEGFSIFRGHRGGKGLCKNCERRRKANLPAVPSVPNSHKTRWI